MSESNNGKITTTTIDSTGIRKVETRGRKKIQIEQLSEDLNREPGFFGYADPFWTIPLVVYHARERYGKKLSESTAHRRLEGIDLRATKSTTRGVEYKQKFDEKLETLRKDRTRLWYATRLKIGTCMIGKGIVKRRCTCYVFMFINMKQPHAYHLNVTFEQLNTKNQETEFIKFIAKRNSEARTYTLILDYDEIERELLKTFYGQFNGNLRVLFMPAGLSVSESIGLKEIDYLKADLKVWLDGFKDSFDLTIEGIKKHIGSRAMHYIS